MRKFIFKKEVPYTFKNVTGLADFDKVGIAIFEEDKMIGGIVYRRLPTMKIFGNDFKTIAISAIEIMPEYRNKGKGTEVIKELLTIYDGISAAVQEVRAWKWWKKLGAMDFMGMGDPEEEGRPNPHIHTLCFIVGKDEIETRILHTYLKLVTGLNENVTQVNKNSLKSDLI